MMVRRVVEPGDHEALAYLIEAQGSRPTYFRLDSRDGVGRLMRMTSRSVLAIALLSLSLAFSGCRQADGPLPQPAGEVPNRIGDISRDLVSVSRGDAQAPQDLADDLGVFVESPAQGRVAVDELSRRTAAVVAGKTLSDQNSQRLAHQLWTAVAGRELSERQVQGMQNDMHTLLVSFGVAENSAEGVAAQVAEVQKAVNARARRWYEFF